MLNFSCFVFVLDYLLFSLHIIPEQNARLSKHRRKSGDYLSTEVLLIHEITTQILNSVTVVHYWEIWLIQQWHFLTYATILIHIQQDATLHSLFYLKTALHVSGGTVTHHQERIQLYLQHLVFVRPLLLPAAIAAGRSNGVQRSDLARR